jgi:hypothetical protein
MRESNYWLKILNEILIDKSDLANKLEESEELKKILGTIYSKTSNRTDVH